MKTLNLNEASNLLKLHSQTVRTKAKSGELPGAKLGKCWVFIESDLLNWIRSQYTTPRQYVSAINIGERTCKSLNEKGPLTGTLNSQLMDKEYTKALELQTK